MSENKRKGRRRLQIDIPEDLFKAVKKDVIDRNITMTRLVTRLLTTYIEHMNSYLEEEN